MARTLSRIACNGIFIFTAAAAVTIAPRAFAQGDVHAAPATQVIDNPFASRAAPQPSPVVVPPTDDGGPKVFQNPFAPHYASPPVGGVRPRGPLSRWRPPVPLPDVGNSTAPANPYPTTPQTSTQSWDQLSPSELGNDQSTQFVQPEVETSAGAPPPDPARFSPSELQQPPWLRPEATDADNAAGGVARKNSTNAATSPTLTAPSNTSSPPVDASDAGQWCVKAKQDAGQAKGLEDLAEVIKDCRQGLTCRPSRETNAALRSLAAWACNRRGELKSEDGREDEALHEFEAAIVWDPNCWLALHNRAVSRAEQGQSAVALADFNRVVELNPGLAVAYRNRGELLSALGRTEEAVADYSRAIEQLPQDADLRTMRGDARHRLGQYPEALADLNRSIELAPQHADTYTERGNVYAEIGDFERAARDFRQALQIDPNCAEAFRSVAWLLATCPDPRFRDPQKAVVAAEQAARLSPPNDPFVLEALAAATAAARQFDRAVRFQTEAVSFAPDGFSDQFAARLALYQQHRPFRNDATRPPRQGVRQARLEVAPPRPIGASTIRPQ